VLEGVGNGAPREMTAARKGTESGLRPHSARRARKGPPLWSTVHPPIVQIAQAQLRGLKPSCLSRVGAQHVGFWETS